MEGNVLLETVNTISLLVYDVKHIVKDHSWREEEEMYLMKHLTQLRLYGVRYMKKDQLDVREETHCITYGVRNMVKDQLGIKRRNLLPPHGQPGFFYMPHPRQDSTYNGLCYTSRGWLARTKNTSMGPP